MNDEFSNYNNFKFSAFDQFEFIDHCRNELGDTDPYTPLNQRAWFTLSSGLYVRKDIGGTWLTTFLILKKAL